MLTYSKIMYKIHEIEWVSVDESVLSAGSRLKSSETGLLLARDGETGHYGILRAQDVLNALCAGAEPESPVGPHAVKCGLVAAAKPVDMDDFPPVGVCLVEDDLSGIIGIATERQAARMLFADLAPAIDCFVRAEERLAGYARSLPDASAGRPRHGEWQDVLDLSLKNHKRVWSILKHTPNSVHAANSRGETIFGNNVFVQALEGAGLSMEALFLRKLEELDFVYPVVTPIVLKEKRTISLLQTGIRTGNQMLVTGVPIWENGRIETVVTDAIYLKEFNVLHDYAKSEQENLRAKLDVARTRDGILYASNHLKSVIQMADKVARLETTVLITGESGTGKGLLARYIHDKSARRECPFVEVNCTAIPESLFESEFFGYETGAFTGAKKGGKRGFLELAHKGTLVLDEVGDMSYPLQSKLLKVLQDKKLTRIGGETEIDVDVRIISTTNKNLADLMKENRFRPDLFYRLNTFPLHLLPLRERVEEIPLLTEYYVRFYNELHEKTIILSQSAVRILRNYPWYGNVRELESCIERLVILFNGVLNESHIHDIMGRHEDPFEAGSLRPLHKEAVAVYRLISLEEALEETKKQLFRLAAQKTTNSSRVARLLGISQPSAYRKLKKYVP